MPATPRPVKTPQPPANSAPAAERLGWALRQRRGDRTRKQLHGQLGYSVSTIKQVETGVYRSDLGPYLAKWAEIHGGLDAELRRLWAEAQREHAASHAPAPPPPAGAPAAAGAVTLPGVPPGTAYLVILVPLEALAGTLGIPDGTRLTRAGGEPRRRTRRFRR